MHLLDKKYFLSRGGFYTRPCINKLIIRAGLEPALTENTKHSMATQGPLPSIHKPSLSYDLQASPSPTPFFRPSYLLTV